LKTNESSTQQLELENMSDDSDFGSKLHISKPN
jgi:hypothetical protein